MRQMIFRMNYYKGLKQLSDDKRLEAYDAIMEYAFGDKQQKASPETAAMLAMIYESMELDFERYEKKISVK